MSDLYQTEENEKIQSAVVFYLVNSYGAFCPPPQKTG